MQLEIHGTAFRRAIIVAGALALCGCASGAYLYDAEPGVHYRGSAGYPPYYSGYPAYSGYLGYYGYPGPYAYPGYYAPPGHYRNAPYPPRVVYYDHDHRGDDCRHESHRRGGGRVDRDRHDRDPHDRDGRYRRHQDGRQEGRAAEQPRAAPPDVRQPPPSQPARGMRSVRVKEPKQAVKSPEARKELE
jgi:hypothetical protein